jgi:hypothetical protein
MVEKVKEVLEPLVLPTAWQLRPAFDGKKTVISYHFFGESDACFGDGEGNEEIGSLQVDIFSLVDYRSTVKEVKRLLKLAKFKFAYANDDVEKVSDSKVIYHKILIFNYIESEVL